MSKQKVLRSTREVTSPSLVLLCLLWFPSLAVPAASAQHTSYRFAKVQDGHPPTQARRLLDRWNLANPQYAELTTGIEDLILYFGPAQGRGGFVSWFAAVQSDTLAGFAFGVPLEADSTGSFVAEFDLPLFYDSGEISTKVWYQPSSGTVSYRWLEADGTTSNRATVRSTHIGFQKGDPAPPLEAEWLGSGDRFQLGDLEKEAVVLNWWHPACAPCRIEIPGLNDLPRQYARRVAFIAITDASRDEVRSFLGKQPFRYRQALLDAKHGKTAFGRGYPYHVILAADGKVFFSQGGGGVDRAQDIARAISRVLE